MTRTILMAAFATGAFCAVFASIVDMVTDALEMRQVVMAGAISGFLGSLFASLVLKRRS